jgi:hypothetical protein
MAHSYPNLTPSESFKSSPQPQSREAHTVDYLSTQLVEDFKVYKARCSVIGVSARENDFWSTLNPLNLGGCIKKDLSATLQSPNTSTASLPSFTERVRTPMLDDRQAFSLLGPSLEYATLPVANPRRRASADIQREKEVILRLGEHVVDVYSNSK